VVWLQNYWDGSLRFGLKTDGDGFLLIWTQNRWLRVFRFRSQNRQLRFDHLGLKITVMISWLDFKTKRVTVYRLRHKTDGGMKTAQGHASRSSGLLHVEASRVRVFQSDLKTDGGATAGGARGTIVEVASISS
jgi:hypothetical protein